MALDENQMREDYAAVGRLRSVGKHQEADALIYAFAVKYLGCADLGRADPATQSYREKHQALGFDVVFHDGMSRQEALDILASPETEELLARATA